MSNPFDLLANYENMTRKEVGATNKNTIKDKLVQLHHDLAQAGQHGLKTGIIRALVDFKSLRKYQAKDLSAQNYALVELQGMLAAARSVLLPPHDQENAKYPTLRELMLFIKNSGAIVVREFPTTFKNFLLQLPAQEMVGIVSIHNLEILARNDVISTQQKAHFQRVLATQTQATAQEKQALRAFVREHFPKFWVQGRREAIQASNQPKKLTMAINVDFTEQCIKDVSRAQSDPDFLDVLHFLRTYLNQERLPAHQSNFEAISYQNLLKLYERNLASYRKAFFNDRLQPLPPNIHSISLSDYGKELWYGYALLNFVHQGNSFWYAHLVGG